MTGPEHHHIELPVEPVLMDRRPGAWCDLCLLPSAEVFIFAVEVAGIPVSWLHLAMCHDCTNIRRVTP